MQYFSSVIKHPNSQRCVGRQNIDLLSKHFIIHNPLNGWEIDFLSHARPPTICNVYIQLSDRTKPLKFYHFFLVLFRNIFPRLEFFYVLDVTLAWCNIHNAKDKSIQIKKNIF